MLSGQGGCLTHENEPSIIAWLTTHCPLCRDERRDTALAQPAPVGLRLLPTTNHDPEEQCIASFDSDCFSSLCVAVSTLGARTDTMRGLTISRIVTSISIASITLQWTPPESDGRTGTSHG